MWDSCLYEGTVSHRRRVPREHRFRYRVFMMYLDLAELPELFRDRWFWSAERPAWAWFRRRDHFGDPRIPLDRAVRDHVERELGRRPSGPIRLLTHLRYLGYCFNPISVAYCFDEEGTALEALLLEVHNTPWGEEHRYTIDPRAGTKAPHGLRQPKRFHVSPFWPMDLEYRFRYTLPGERLEFHVDSLRSDEPVFSAAFAGERRPINGRSLAWTLVRFPFMTGSVIAAIYFEALRLWWKGMPWHNHPGSESTPGGSDR